MTKKAVALKYDKNKDKAPIVIANGKNNNAKKIIEMAEKFEIPIKKDEDLIEILSKIEINQEIPPNLYKAVAEIFSFLYSISKK